MTWLLCLLPTEFRTRHTAVRLAHHLSKLPHVADDADLSLPIAFLAGFVLPETLGKTELSNRLGVVAIEPR